MFGYNVAWCNKNLGQSLINVIALTGRMQVCCTYYVFGEDFFQIFYAYSINSKKCYSKWLAIDASMYVVESLFAHQLSFVSL